MKLAFVTEMYKNMFSIKKNINSLNILYTASHKIFRYITAYKGKYFKHILMHLHDGQNIIKLTYVIHKYKSMFPSENGICKTNDSCTEMAKLKNLLPIVGKSQ